MSAVVNARCMRDLPASASNQLHWNRSREWKRTQTPLLKVLFMNHHLVLFKHIDNDRTVQLGRHGWCTNPLPKSVWLSKLILTELRLSEMRINPPAMILRIVKAQKNWIETFLWQIWIKYIDRIKNYISFSYQELCKKYLNGKEIAV